MTSPTSPPSPMLPPPARAPALPSCTRVGATEGVSSPVAQIQESRDGTGTPKLHKHYAAQDGADTKPSSIQQDVANGQAQTLHYLT